MEDSSRYWEHRVGMVAPVRLRLGLFLAVFSLCVALPAWAGGEPRENARTAVGSLTVNGAVEVNGAPVSAQSDVFVGDTVSTDESGNAILMISGKGELDVAPSTQLVFSDNPRYLAVVNHGSVTFNTMAEGSNIGVRAGDYIVRASSGAPAKTAGTVQRESDGSGLVSCAAGSVQVVAIQGDTSVMLQDGQSTSLAEGETVAATVPSDEILESPPKTVKRHWLRTVVIIVGGAAVAGAIVVAHGGGHGAARGQSASPTPTPTPTPAPPPITITL